MEQSPILVIGAMEVEVDFLLEQMKDYKENTIANYHFYEGVINSYPIVIAKSGVGTIHATAATTLAIEKYHPICIISQGTAGGIGRKAHVKDIVIGAEVFHIMSAKTPIKEENEGSNSTKWDYLTFISGEVDRKITQKGNEKLISFFKEFGNSHEQGEIHVGVIGSGDIWDREKDKILYLSEVHQVLCEEMEGIGIYTIANEYKIPVIDIRVISNNELLGEKYDRNIGEICQRFVYEGIKEMIGKMKED